MKLIKILLTTVLFVFLSNLTFSQGQCLGGGCTGGSQYPSSTLTSNTNSWAVVSTLIWGGDYAVYNVTNGSQYEWSFCTADGGSLSFNAQLTLLNSTGTTILCYSDDYCETNKPKIQWTATFTGTVRVYVTEFSCATNMTSATLVWRCSSCGSGSAPANDNCSGATTVSVTADCSSPTNGTVSGATNSVVTPCVGTSEDDVWYKFTTTTAGYYDITVIGSASFDAVVDLRSGACNGTNIACADNTNSGGTETISALLAATTTYYVRVYDYWSYSPSTLTFTICITKPAVCTPLYSTGTSDGDFINRVQLGTIDNTPGGTGSTVGASYNDYYSSVAATNLQAGSGQTLTVTVGTYGSQTVAAWIDYNQDGDFSDAGESLGEINNVAASSTAVFNFTVSVTATSGNTRMRIRTVWSDVGIDPCASYSFGEAEDYKVNITPACITPGTPASLSTSGIGVSSATLNWVAGTPAGSATVTYYWAVNLTSTVDYETNYVQRGTTTSLTSGVLSGFLNGTTYYWTVKASTSCDATLSLYASAINFTTSCTTPGTPNTLSTTNISTTSAILNWVSGAAGSPTVSYYWAVGSASNVTYEANYLQRGITTNLNNNVFTLTANTSYWWTVKAVTTCNGSASSYPAAISFTTLAVPTPLITWTGSTSTSWDVTTNWSPAQVPVITDNVVIPDVSAGSNRYPLIASGGLSINNASVARQCLSLHINSGASVTIYGSTIDQYLYCSGILNIYGILNFANDNAGGQSFRVQINSGGVLTVKNGGILNVGSSAISGGLPSGTVNQFNDIKINDGTLNIDPGAKTFIMDDLQITGTAGVKGKLSITGGELWIKYYGDGSTGSLGFDTFANSILNISSGDIYLCGRDQSTSNSALLDWNPSTTVNITGGTLHLALEQSSGTTNKSGRCDFAGKTINNLEINRSGLVDSLFSNIIVNGNLTISAGTLNAHGFDITLAGNWTNNGSFTDDAGTGTTTFTGSGKLINGSSGTTFNIVNFNSGASYTIDPSYVTIPQATFNGNLTVNSNATLTLATTKIINLAGASNTINGTLTAVDNLDGTRDIGLNNVGGQLSGTGSLNADLQVSSGTTTLMNDFTINGDFFINTGTFVMSSHTLTINGSYTNNGTFTHGTGTIILAGTSKNITGTAADGANSWLNNLTIPSAASYTFNPTATNWDIDGSLNITGTLNLSANKYLDVYSSTVGGESVVLNGTITAATANDGTRDIDLNSTVVLSGNGSTNADLRIYSGTTTLSSDFILGGGFEINSGAGFTMTTHTFSVESWKNRGTFTAGTGNVKFTGSAYRTVDANCSYSGAANAASDFYNVEINRGVDTLAMFNKPMRVANNFTISNGIFSTGWHTDHSGTVGQNRRLTIVKIATIATTGKLFIGYWKACGAAGEGLPCGSSDSLNIPVFLGDLMNYGAIITNRPLLSGYSDMKLTGARITGAGNANEFGVDIQPEDNSTVTQVGPVDIEGDLIIQDPSTNLWESSDPDNILTVRGNFYLYGSFTHNGTVNIYGNMTNGGNVSDTVTINASTFNFYQTGTKYFMLDKNPTAFGNVNIKTGTGTRQIRQNITVTGDLTIESGSTLDAYTSNSTITLSGTTSSWYNNGSFTPQLGTVTFNGGGLQVMGGLNQTTFYNLTMNKGNSSELTLGNIGTVNNLLTLTAGFMTSDAARILKMANGSTTTPVGGSSTCFVKGPVKKVGNTSYIFPIGKGSTWARLEMQNVSGEAAGDEFTAEYFNSSYVDPDVSDAPYQVTTPLHHASGLEYWNLDRNVGTATKKIGLYSESISTSLIDAFNDADLTVAHWNNTTNKWEDVGNTANSGAGSSGWILSGNMSGFSPITFGSKTAKNPLPIELLSFNVTVNGKKVDLKWTTASEYNNDYFTIEKSKDLFYTEIVGKVPGAGNSNITINYFLIDQSPYSGISYYRLKQTDFDGKFTYSEWVAVEFKTQEISDSKYNIYENSLNIVNVYPNPSRGEFFITLNISNSQTVRYAVLDLMGKQLVSKQINLMEGISQTKLNIEDLHSGTYLLIIYGKSDVIQKKIIKQ